MPNQVPGQVDADHPLPRLERALHGIARPGRDSSVVDGEVEAAELLQRDRHSLSSGLFGRHIADHQDTAPAAGLDQRQRLHERFFALTAQHDLGAELREGDGCRLADTLAGAGHDDDTTGELVRHGVTLALTTRLVL